MKRDLEYYDRLPWRVAIEPERQDNGRILFVASRQSMIEALLVEGYPIPEPSVVPSAVE
jgi:hypothetical protein